MKLIKLVILIDTHYKNGNAERDIVATSYDLDEAKACFNERCEKEKARQHPDIDYIEVFLMAKPKPGLRFGKILKHSKIDLRGKENESK